MKERKKPGPKPSGRPPKRPMSFTVSEKHRAWLDALPPGERSKWLADQIDRAMRANDSQHESAEGSGEQSGEPTDGTGKP